MKDSDCKLLLHLYNTDINLKEEDHWGFQIPTLENLSDVSLRIIGQGYSGTEFEIKAVEMDKLHYLEITVGKHTFQIRGMIKEVI